MTSRARDRRGVWTRLALLPVLVLGAYLWKRPSWPQERDCLLLPPAKADHVRGVDLQIYGDTGALFSRQVRQFAAGMTTPWRSRVVLPEGRYQVQAFVQWVDGNTSSLAAPLEVRDRSALELALPSESHGG